MPLPGDASSLSSLATVLEQGLGLPSAGHRRPQAKQCSAHHDALFSQGLAPGQNPHERVGVVVGREAGFRVE